MKFLTDILAKAGLVVDGAVTLNSVANSSVDTDKFLVIESNVVKYRTGTQILSDIGAAAVAAGLPVGGTAGQILAKIDGTNYNAQWIDNYAAQLKHIVKLGQNMTIGTPVYVSSADGTNMIVSKASYSTEQTSSKVLGLLAEGGVTNDQRFVITEGLLAGIDTSTANAGDPVWLGANGALLFGLANKPVAPNHMVYLGVVTRVQSNNGEIFVKVQNGFEIDELHDVLVSGLLDKHILYRDATTNLWKNASISTVLGYTPANATSISGTVNRIAKFTSTSAVGDSQIFDNGTNVSIGTLTPISTSILTLTGTNVLTKSIFLDSTWSYQTSFSMRNGIYYTEFNLGGATKSNSEGGPGSFQIAHYNSSTAQYIIPITFFANGNIAFAGGTASVPSDQGQTLQVQGSTRISALAGTGTRIVVANASGVLSTGAVSSSITTGSGTTNYVSKWTPDGVTLGNSQIFDNGTSIGVGLTSPLAKFHVNGSIRTSAFEDQVFTYAGSVQATYTTGLGFNSDVVTKDGVSATFVFANNIATQVKNTGVGTNYVANYAIGTTAEIGGTTTGALIYGAGGYFQLRRRYSDDVSTNSSNGMYGVIARVFIEPAAPASIVTSTAYAYDGGLNLNTGTITTASGVDLSSNIGHTNTSNATTVTTYHGIRIRTIVGSTSGGTTVVTNYYGIYLANPTINTTGSITNRWALYSLDTAASYIEGNLLIGTTSSSGYKLQVNGTAYISGQTTLANLAGSGSRMVVTDANGLLSTQTIPVSSGGTVTSVAALTIGTTGTDITSTVVTSTTTPVITLNIPSASASNRGALTSTDWTTFNNKQSALNGTGFVRMSGTTVSYITGTSSQFVKADGTLDSTAYTTNTGTVTSVGLSLPSIFSISGSPVTTTGTLTASLISQTANQFFAAPNGTAGVPTFRVIVAADIPTLNQNTTGSAGSVVNNLIIRADSGTTEGTDIYTFNGSANKNINIVAGSNITITKIAGQWTIASATGTSLNGTGYVKMSGTAVTYIASIPNTDLANSSITVQGTAVSLGGSVNVINGTGFVKASGTTITYDNSTYYLASNPNGYTSNAGTVTSVSIVSANGFAGTVATSTTTPAITLSTTITGLLKGNGTAISAAVAGTDYQTPITNPVTGTGTTNYIPKWSGTSSQTNSQIFDDGTNVGIGTATPGGSFHMANVSGAIFGSAAGSIGTLQLTSSSPVSPISGRLLFGTDGTGWQFRIAKNTNGTITDLVYLQDNGNFGIGASSPGAPLHIIKTGGSVNSINIGLIVDYEATAAEQTGAGTAIRFRGKSGGGNIGNYDQAQIATNNVGSNNSHGLSFYYKPDASTSLTEGFRLHANGFVGIGTASPASNLQVGDAGTAGSRSIRITDSGYGLLLSGGSSSTNNYIQSLGTTIPLYFLAGNANNANYVFSSTGRMGIGATSPGGKVHIKQAASEIPLLIDSSASANAAYTQYLVGASGGWEVGMAGSGDSYKWFFSYGSFGAANAKITFTNGGNVGIGTISPTFVTGGGLHVKMSADSNIRITSGANTGFDLTQASDGTNYIYNRDNSPFIFGTNNIERVRIAADGKLIVNSSTSFGAYQFQVNGAVYLSGQTTLANLAGTGTRMVVADANGLLSTQAIPTGGGGTGTVTSVGLTIGSSGTDVNVSNSPITTSGNITLNIPDASASARGLVNTTTQTFAGDKTFTGQTTLNVTRTSATNGSYGMYMLTTYNFAAGDSNKNIYTSVDSLVLNLTNGALSGSQAYNVTANLNQVSVGGNASTISTQPMRGIIMGLLGIPGGTPMNIADFRYMEAKIPDNAGLSGHIVTSIFGMRIGSLKGTSGFTITNGWGIYQEGTQDNNYFAGSVVIGSSTVGSYKLDVTSNFRVNTGTVPVAIESFANPGIGTVASVYSTGTNSTIAFGSQANDTYLVGGYVFIGNQSAKLMIQADTLTGGYDGWGSIGSSAKYMKEVYTNYLVNKQVFSRKTASYTLVSGDRSKVIEMNVGSANTLTVPTNASVAFPIGTQITIIQYGAGQTTIAGAGVTFRSTNNWLKINAQYGSATLVKVGTDEWYVIGNLSA